MPASQPEASTSTKLSSVMTSSRISGKAAMKAGTMPGSTSREALTGTLSFSVPAGRSRKVLTTSSAASTSDSAGPSRSRRRRPASVGATLRVVRLRRRTPSPASSRRIASLSPEALRPESRAPSRNPSARATATKALRSLRSAFIVRVSVQLVRIVTDYRAVRQALTLRHRTRRKIMANIEKSGTWRLGDRGVKRLGYGAMQLAGKGVFGPPKDHDAAIAVLREAIAAGIDHIDTSDFYGPHVTNELIREALHPYPDDLVIVTKVGARRNDKAEWVHAFSPEEIRQAVHDNLRNLGLEAMEVVNLRNVHGIHEPEDVPLGPQLEMLAELKRQGLVRH